MLRWSPKPPSGPATSACHVALPLLLTAVASSRLSSCADGSILPAVTAHTALQFHQCVGPGEGQGFICVSNSLMMHFEDFILNSKKTWVRETRTSCLLFLM